MSNPHPRGSTAWLVVEERLLREEVDATHRALWNCERERDEAVARAERAEAECGAMRAVVEAAERQEDAAQARAAAYGGTEYRGKWSLWEQAATVTEAAVVEWRRTRQSKEPASSPPDPEGPADEEVEALAKELFAAARNRWIWDSRNDMTKNEWRCAAREAWRLGARMKEK